MQMNDSRRSIANNQRKCYKLSNDALYLPSIEDVEHTVEVTADSLYEAVARGIRVARDADFGGRIIGRVQTMVMVPSNNPGSSTKSECVTSRRGSISSRLARRDKPQDPPA